MKTLHLIYPCSKKISTPDAIGFQLQKYLSKKYKVIIYDWSSLNKIKDINYGDILIGHANANPISIFRRSMKDSRWGQVILLQPFNTFPEHVAYLEHVIHNVDKFIAITGRYWVKNIEITTFNRWRHKFLPLDLAVDREQFPSIKSQYGKPGRRTFLYIGNGDPCKNLSYLREIAVKYDPIRFATIGASIPGIKAYGFLNFSKGQAKEIIKKYDFLIITSYADANPTVVLESMSWGLLPICTPTCGYGEEDGVQLLSLTNIDHALKLITELDNMADDQLKKLRDMNNELLDQKFNWDFFCKKVEEYINQPVVKVKIKRNYLNFYYEIKSQRFFLRPSNLKKFLKDLIELYLLKKSL
jgi:hypothetical protein